jgi:prephenate dehydrogenase
MTTAAFSSESLPSQPFTHLTVVGLGLIGGSFALAARQAYPGLTIHGVDTDPATQVSALAQGTLTTASADLPTHYTGHHLVVLATHLHSNQTYLTQLAPLVAGQSVSVMDLGSCKRAICELGQQLLPNQFVGAHPMAGKERSGFAVATPELFRGKTFLFCPTEVTLPTVYPGLSAFVQGLGAMPRVVDPVTHDHIMAYVSHLPQLYAVMLTNLLARHDAETLLAFHGGGIDDQLRLAASPFAMWGQVYAENQDNMLEALAAFGQILQDATHDLATQSLAPWFEQSNQVHQAFQQLKQQALVSP